VVTRAAAGLLGWDAIAFLPAGNRTRVR